jgi:hypothetical protein
MLIRKNLIAAAAALLFAGLSHAQSQQVDLQYGAHPLQSASFFKNAQSKRLMIWVHGGGWAAGDKLDPTSRVAIQEALDNGYAVLSINYRLVPNGGRFEEQNADVRNAIRSAITGTCQGGGLVSSRSRGAQRVANNRICDDAVWQEIRNFATRGYAVMGGSAGGNLAVTASGMLLRSGLQGPLKCVGNLAGPIDFNNLSSVQPMAVNWIQNFAAPRRIADIDVESLVKAGRWSSGRNITWITGYSPNDRIVPPNLIEPGLHYLHGPGNDVDTIRADGLGHDHPNQNEVIMHSMRYVAQKCNLK